MSGLLALRGVHAFYGRMPVVHGVDLDVDTGEVVALLGANGAGKTTVLRAISRAVRTTGEILLEGASTARLSVDAVARAGVGHVPEGRGTFPDLTVGENLRLGMLARGRADRAGAHADHEEILGLFGVLEEMSGRPAGSLSGGQQQMLALARALLARPRLLLLDEPSLGLAPRIAAEIFAALARLRKTWGLSVLVAEQNVGLALALADRAYLMETGRVSVSGTAAALADDPAVRRAYLGD
jgi:branched-chain amino acid transport system ATP-binding protein